jgi:hypothetical protein
MSEKRFDPMFSDKREMSIEDCRKEDPEETRGLSDFEMRYYANWRSAGATPEEARSAATARRRGEEQIMFSGSAGI